MKIGERKSFTFITEDENGSIENFAELIQEENQLKIILISAVRLSDRQPCPPCSAAQLTEYLNNISNQ